MGKAQSKDQTPPSAPCTVLSDPWRKLDWSKRDEMKEHIRTLQISVPDVKQLRILICGPVGAGKSTFINSIDSIFQGRMSSIANPEATIDHSCTKTLRSHKIKDGKYRTSLSFVLCDTKGLEGGDLEGAHPDDLMSILEGHIKDGYEFDTARPANEKMKDPDLKQKIHCLVTVVPADSLLWCADKEKVPEHATQEVDTAFIQKLKAVRQRANDLDIPQIVILSKVDEACAEIKKDLKMVYNSTVVQKKIECCSVNVGIPLNHIFPVKNYHEEIDLHSDVDVVLLSALTTILNFANDHVAVMAERKIQRNYNKSATRPDKESP